MRAYGLVVLGHGEVARRGKRSFRGERAGRVDLTWAFVASLQMPRFPVEQTIQQAILGLFEMPTGFDTRAEVVPTRH